MKGCLPMKVFRLCAVSIAIFWALSAFAQVLTPPALKADWARVYIENVGSIDLPPTMEVQGGQYKEFSDDLLGSYGFKVSSQLIAQQKGLNEYKGPKGQYAGKYARVMVDTETGNYGDYDKLNFNIHEYKKSDIAELDKIYKQYIQQESVKASRSGLGQMKLIEWYPLKFENINGMSCIHVSYTRQMNDNPLVLVHMYVFQNNDRVHNLTMSYRQSESDYWKNDFSHILNSFRITNIR